MNLVRALDLAKATVISICGSGGKTSLMIAIARELACAGERVLATATTKLGVEEMNGPWQPLQAARAETIINHALRDDAPITLAFGAIDGVRGKLIGLAPNVIDAVADSKRFDRIIVEADGSRKMPLKAPAEHEPVFPTSTQAVVIVAGASGLGKSVGSAVFRPERWRELAGHDASGRATPEALARVIVHPEGLARSAPESARRILFINQVDGPLLLKKAQEVLDWVFSLDGATPDRAAIGRLRPEPRLLSVRKDLSQAHTD